jgi:hypothetical protein
MVQNGLAVHFLGSHGQCKVKIAASGNFDVLEELFEEVEGDFDVKLHRQFY